MIEAPAVNSKITMEPTNPILKHRKVVATDIDGTFLDNHHKVRDDVAALYLKLKACPDVTVIPATGRMVYALRGALARISPTLIKDFNFFPGVYGHGSVAYGESQDDVIHSQFLPREAVQLILKQVYQYKKDLEAEKRCPGLFSITLYGLRGMTVDQVSDEFESFCKKYEEYHDETLGRSFLDEGMLEGERGNVFNISITCPGPLLQELYKIFENESVSSELTRLNVRSVFPIPEQLHFMSAGQDKGKAFQLICERYGWTKDDVLALGDSYNDLEMISWAGHGVAMGNAVPELKELADEVTLENGQGGWVAAVSKHTGVSLGKP